MNETAVVSQRASGLPLTLFAMVEPDHENPANRKRLQDWCNKTPLIQQAYVVTGTTDVIMIVLVRDVEQYVQLMSRMPGQNPAIRRVITNVNLEKFKVGPNVPADYAKL